MEVHHSRHLPFLPLVQTYQIQHRWWQNLATSRLGVGCGQLDFVAHQGASSIIIQGIAQQGKAAVSKVDWDEVVAHPRRLQA